jgi:pimeloyl-ACP methyl ester carboxylesterase
VTFHHAAASAYQQAPRPVPLPTLGHESRITHDGARIWFGTLGTGSPVILLHGGLTSSDSWGNQVRALVDAHYRVILIDSRGHGRSTRDGRPLTYERMERDVIAVMDALHVERAAVVGWSDGAVISLIMAMKDPERVTKVFAFGANMDRHGVNPAADSAPILSGLSARLAAEYARISPTPDEFRSLAEAVRSMQSTQPNYSAADLASIHGPKIVIADGDHEEFITRPHTDYLARTIPGARLVILPSVSHFAPWQSPGQFNRALLLFLDR